MTQQSTETWHIKKTTDIVSSENTHTHPNRHTQKRQTCSLTKTHNRHMKLWMQAKTIDTCTATLQNTRHKKSTHGNSTTLQQLYKTLDTWNSESRPTQSTDAQQLYKTIDTNTRHKHMETLQLYCSKVLELFRKGREGYYGHVKDRTCHQRRPPVGSMATKIS